MYELLEVDCECGFIVLYGKSVSLLVMLSLVVLSLNIRLYVVSRRSMIVKFLNVVRLFEMCFDFLIIVYGVGVIVIVILFIEFVMMLFEIL